MPLIVYAFATWMTTLSVTVSSSSNSTLNRSSFTHSFEGDPYRSRPSLSKAAGARQVEAAPTVYRDTSGLHKTSDVCRICHELGHCGNERPQTFQGKGKSGYRIGTHPTAAGNGIGTHPTGAGNGIGTHLAVASRPTRTYPLAPAFLAEPSATGAVRSQPAGFHLQLCIERRSQYISCSRFSSGECG